MKTSCPSRSPQHHPPTSVDFDAPSLGSGADGEGFVGRPDRCRAQTGPRRCSFQKPRVTSRVFITGRDSCYKFAMPPKSRAEVELAQTLTHYPVGGGLLARTRYGDECFGRRPSMVPCHDCGVTKGQLHIPCCEVEECPNCLTQLLSCDCDLGDACSAD